MNDTFEGDYQVMSPHTGITAWVYVEDSIVVDTAPVLKKFVGQRMINLMIWLGEGTKAWALEDV